MARKQETNEYVVDDGKVEITITALGGVDASKLGIKLGAMLGPSVVSLFAAWDDHSAQAGAQAGKELFERLTPQSFEGIAKEVLAGAQMKTLEGEFEDVTMGLLNETFSGNVASIYKLVFDAVRINFRNFSQGFGISSAALARINQIVETQKTKLMPAVKATGPTP